MKPSAWPGPRQVPRPATRLGEGLMSGWQRIGVVISVLWILSAPIALVVSQNNSASSYYASCRSTNYDIASNYRQAGRNDLADAIEAKAHDECWKVPGFTTISKLGSYLVAGDAQSGILWLFLLVPLAAFWVICGIIFSTVRWIRRGFVSAQKVNGR
jgi:hypothetical protein